MRRVYIDMDPSGGGFNACDVRFIRGGEPVGGARKAEKQLADDESRCWFRVSDHT